MMCPWIHPKSGFLAPTPPPQPTEPHSTQSGPSVGGTSRVSGGLRGLHLGGSPPSPRPPSPCSSAPQGPAVRGGPGLRQGEMHAGLREEHHPQHVLRRRPPGRRRFVPGEKSPFCHLLLSPPPTWGGAELGVPGWGWRLGAHWGSLGFLPPLICIPNMNPKDDQGDGSTNIWGPYLHPQTQAVTLNFRWVQKDLGSLSSPPNPSSDPKHRWIHQHLGSFSPPPNPNNDPKLQMDPPTFGVLIVTPKPKQ